MVITNVALIVRLPEIAAATRPPVNKLMIINNDQANRPVLFKFTFLAALQFPRIVPPMTTRDPSKLRSPRLCRSVEWHRPTARKENKGCGISVTVLQSSGRTPEMTK